jgi:hypothetical protein
VRAIFFAGGLLRAAQYPLPAVAINKPIAIDRLQIKNSTAVGAVLSEMDSDDLCRA